MGYVFTRSTMEALKDVHSDDPATRQRARATVKASLDSYEAYKASMRSGLFGLLIGRKLYKARRL